MFTICRIFSNNKIPKKSNTRVSEQKKPKKLIVRGYSQLRRDYSAERILLDVAKRDPSCNMRSNIIERIGSNLHLKKGHPLNTIKNQIQTYFNDVWAKGNNTTMAIFDDLSPVMSTIKAFDELLIPRDHPSRQPTDTYYLSEDICLRPHTSAHQNEILKSGSTSFLCTGDVYRRDSIDATHFPIFHQMEGVHVFDKEFLQKVGGEKEQVEFVVHNMKMALEGLARHLFGDVKFRWNGEYFPFTDPSFEVEIFFRDQWLEVLGCGVIHQKILQNCNLPERKGWAFGLGLERLAMILFSIPDIRLFWSQDPRFLQQFSSGKLTKFQPYSKHEVCTKDISFWVPSQFHEHAFFDLVRDVARDLVEGVVLVDQFVHPESQKVSKCYRVSYRSMDKNLTNKEVDPLQAQIRAKVVSELGVTLR